MIAYVIASSDLEKDLKGCRGILCTPLNLIPSALGLTQAAALAAIICLLVQSMPIYAKRAHKYMVNSELRLR